MMSLAQFRPEKKQLMQINILSELINKVSEINSLSKMMKLKGNRKIVLNICGTTRGEDDERILQSLKNRA